MRFYFLGIGGVAMGQAAILLQDLGHDVLGTDGKLYPPMSEVLEKARIPTMEGYDPGRLEGLSPDAVVVGNAFSRGNPEIEWLLETRKFPLLSLPQLLRDELLLSRQAIVVAGTHGKTTTTALTAHLLQEALPEAGWFIGGAVEGMPAARAGRSKAPFVIEGDEYDSAFFDKRSKFIHYAPEVVVLNNLEMDHADIFHDLRDLKRSFSHLLRLVPRNGAIIANGDDPVVADLLHLTWTTVIRVGQNPRNDVRLVEYKDFTADREMARFVLEADGEVRRFSLPLPGLHNARNAAMAVVAVNWMQHRQYGVAAVEEDALIGFAGVRRRSQLRYQSDRLTVMEDFAHHPTAVAATIDALRHRYANQQIVAAFEPRSATACRDLFQEEWARSFRGVDEVLIGAEFVLGRVPAGRLDPDRLAQDLGRSGMTAQCCRTHREVLAQLRRVAEKKGETVVVFFSNGGFGGIISEFVTSLPATAASPERLAQDA